MRASALVCLGAGAGVIAGGRKPGRRNLTDALGAALSSDRSLRRLEPVGFIALVNHYRNTLGFNWLAALGSLVALSLVIATAVIAIRR